MPDYLAQFQQGKGIDVQKSPEEIQKDKEYDQPLNVSLEDQKADLMESLYGVKKPDDVIDEVESELHTEYNNNFSENHENINNEVEKTPDELLLTEINEKVDNKDFSSKDLYNTCVNKIKVTGPENKEISELTKKMSEYIIGHEKLPENKESKETKEKQLVELLETDEVFEDFLENIADQESLSYDIYEMMIDNFVNFHEDPEISLNLMMVNVGESITDKYKNIPNTKTKEVAIKEFNSLDLGTQLFAIEKLYTLAQVGAASGARMEKNKQFITKNGEKQKQHLIDQYQELQQELIIAGEKSVEGKKIQEKINEVIAQAEELDSGDVFDAGEIDKLAENNGDKIKEAA